MSTPATPEIGKLIGPSVAAELCQTIEELEPLLTALGESNAQESAEHALHHLVGALLAEQPSRSLIGPNAGPWCQLVERVSRNLRASVAYPVRSLLITLCDNPEDFTPEQRRDAGLAARRLLEFAWAQARRDSWLVIHALRCVCRTFESDPEASASLIRRCIEREHLKQFGFEELLRVAEEVGRLVPFDPKLVEEIYRAAFAYQEQSEEPTPMGTSRILPLISNRRQDYQMALYELAEVFPAFLESAPKEATRALVRVVESYVAQKHPLRSSETQEESFDFAGQQAWVRTDYSAIWDEGDTYRHNEPINMLDAFQSFLERLAGQQDGKERLRSLIRILVSGNRLAVIWRRLLLAGTRFPETIGREILPLATAVPILTGLDTTVPAGEYLKVIFPILGEDERRKMERVILSIPDAMPEDLREEAERVRDRLLGCLPPATIVTREARQRLQEMQARGAVPSNEPPVRFESWSSAYGEEEYLREQGVPVDNEPNRRIRELERPVKKFSKTHLNSIPVLEEVKAVLPEVKALYDALCRADKEGVHPKQRDYAWGTLAEACAIMARSEGLCCNEEPGAFIRDVLLEASQHSNPVPSRHSDAQFDESLSWGKPAPRIDAAAGLIVLARNASCVTEKVLTAIERLSIDSVPAVRFQIAWNLNALYRTAPEKMWRIAERMAQQEESRGVLQGLVATSLGRLAGAETDRVVNLARTIWDRVTEGPGAKKVRDFCIDILTGLYIWRDHLLSREIVQEIISHPDMYSEEANHLLAQLRNALTHGPTDCPDPQADAVRRRALVVLQRLLGSAQSKRREIEERNAGIGFNEWPETDRETTTSLMHLIDGIGREVYFASGAYDTKRPSQVHGVREVSPQSERFYREVGTILDDLADAGLPSITHHLLETLEYFIPVDPRGVFLRIHRVVLAGEQAGYQYESLAADLIVRLVERYLAEYRTLLQQDGDCRRALIEILDIFVKAGWPSARRLVYRLEEIFR